MKSIILLFLASILLSCESEEEQKSRIVNEAVERYKPRFEALRKEQVKQDSDERFKQQILENQRRSLEYQRRNDEINRMRMRRNGEVLMQDLIGR